MSIESEILDGLANNNDVLSCIERNVKGFLFADDLTVTCSGYTLKATLK